MKAFNKERELRKLKFKQNKGKYIKYGTIGISCLMLVLGVMYFTFAKFESKSPEWTLINGKVKYDGGGDANIIAIYKDGEKVDDIPVKGSGYNFEKSECTNGANANWDNNKWNLIINLTQKTKCSLYFKKSAVAFQIIDLVSGSSTTSTEIINKGTNSDGTTNTLAYDGTADNNLRYVGANPANYVNYNCDSNGENCELWRIIGVFNNIYTTKEDYNNKTNGQTLIKLIRNEIIGLSKYNYGLAWDSSASGTNEGLGVNEWSQADLMKELNTDYLGNITVGTDGNWYSGSKNSKSWGMPSTTINSDAQNMIESVVWNTGTNGSDMASTWTPSNMYTYERSTNTGKICTSGTRCNDSITRTTTWYGKVALMYPSDYGYATGGSSRSTCLNTQMYSSGWGNNSSCISNDWLSKSKNQWTLMPKGDSVSTNVFRISSSGYVDSSYAGSGNELIAPSIFLKSTVQITGGTGTSTDPYTLG